MLAVVGALLLFVLVSSAPGQTNEVVPEPSALREAERQTPDSNSEKWSWHVQNTDILQGYPAFSARYSGPNSLRSGGEIRETVSLNLLLAVRLWPGAEAHLDQVVAAVAERNLRRLEPEMRRDRLARRCGICARVEAQGLAGRRLDGCDDFRRWR